MHVSGLTFTITTIANLLSENLSDDELNLVAASFTQLGDTLTTISVQRSFYNKNNSSII